MNWSPFHARITAFSGPLMASTMLLAVSAMPSTSPAKKSAMASNLSRNQL